MEVFTADDESSVHFGGHDGAGEDTATDGDEAGKRTFLVYKNGLSPITSTTAASKAFISECCVKNGSLPM